MHSRHSKATKTIAHAPISITTHTHPWVEMANPCPRVQLQATKEWKLCHVSQPHDENVTKCFSESNETQKGHKRQQRQGVR